MLLRHRKIFRIAWSQKMEQNSTYGQVLRSSLTNQNRDNKKNPYRGFLYSYFFSQKSIFSKFFELSRNSSCRIRPGFVVLFHYSKDFKLTFTMPEKKNRFFEEKWSFVKEWCMFILTTFEQFLYIPLKTSFFLRGILIKQDLFDLLGRE